MKKKGFTLIELIAVIVILAIITLIAVPIISKVVDKARKGAAEASALNYIDAVEKYVILHDLDSTKYPYDLKNNTFNVSSNTEISFLDIIIPRAKAESTIPSLNSFITIKGDKPKSGTVTLNEKGKVTEAELGFGKYFAECTSGKCVATKEKTSIVIDGEDTKTVVVGDTVELNAITNSDKEITWSSSDNTIATVNNGAVTGVKAGTVSIKAKVEKAEAIVTINVENVSVSIDGDKPRNASKGTNLELSVTTNSKSSVSWTSSDNTIATVNNGVVSPLKYGSVTITATIGDASDSVVLNVKTGATKDLSDIYSSSNVKQLGVKGIVYLNPSDLSSHCTISNSTVGNGVTGCMKWYIFSDSGSKYKLILDHNTANSVVWGNTYTAYDSSGAKTHINGLNWDSSLNRRIITTNEIDAITGRNHNNSWYYLDNGGTSSSVSGIGTSKYAWLYDYTYTCNSHGCNIAISSNDCTAYWTSDTGYFNGYWGVWYVYAQGYLHNGYYASMNGATGVRPVIEVDKSIIN